jgi:hypothetical protein
MELFIFYEIFSSRNSFFFFLSVNVSIFKDDALKKIRKRKKTASYKRKIFKNNFCLDTLTNITKWAKEQRRKTN